MPLQIINRRDYLHNWAAREAESPAKGNLRRGEIAIAIVTDDGTDTGNITEVIGRIGPSDTPTPFSDCPVVFRSPRGFKGADVRPVLVDDAPSTNAVLAYDNAAGKFITVDEDPGTYEEVDGTEGGEGGGNELEEIVPTILLVQSSGLASQAVVDTSPTYTLTVEVIGRPDPILDIEIEETAWPDHANNALNYTTSTAYHFSTDNLPQGVSVSVVDSATLGELGARTYTITGLAVNRSVPMSRVAINARIGASNPAGSSPVTFYATQGQIEFIEDPAESAQAPAIASVVISEGGQATNKIANLATGGTATLTASYLATDFTEGVDNGTVTYQWFKGATELVGETNASVTITNDADRYNDTQLSVQVSISDLDGSDSRRGYIAIGDYDEGFTELTPSADSRLVYVANDGDDAAAVAVHGRGYYLPSDPEIGPDPTNPIGPIVAYATPDHGWSKVRKIHWESEAGGVDSYGFGNVPRFYPQSTRGFPDWLLYKRGDTFAEGKGTGYVNNIGFNVVEFRTAWRGRSADEPAVMTAWGTPSDPRPVFTSNLGPGARDCNVRYVSLDLPNHSMGFEGFSGDLVYDEDVLVEDCRARTFGANNLNVNVGLRYRRCVVTGNFSATSHNQGLFISSYAGGGGWVQNAAPEDGGSPLTDVLFEECIFDRNGYKENPYDASTWTAGIWGGNGQSLAAAGLGVQPKRTYFDRNIYVATGGPDRKATVTIRGSLFSRAGGGGSVQMRQGGIVERCVWLSDESPGFVAADTSIYKDCLRLGSEIFHNASYYDMGFFINAQHGWWPGAWGAVIDGCIVAGGIPSGRPAFAIRSDDPSNANANIALVNSDAIRHGLSGIDDRFTTGTFASLQLLNNRIYIEDEGGLSTIDCAAASSVFGNGSEPCRDLVTYMSSIDPAYAALLATDPATNPDHPENVRVDEDCTVFQSERIAVRDVWTHNVSADRAANLNRAALSDADARLLARRYHAFLTFIERAKENRKHAWDSRYTADAVNNYIREGFGKPLVGGAYTASLADLGAYA